MSQPTQPNSPKVSLWIPCIAAILAIGLAALNPEFAKKPISALFEVVGSAALEYLMYGIGAFVIFWIGLHVWLKRKQLSRTRWPSFDQVKRELVFSLCAQFIMLGVGIWLTLGNDEAVGNYYADVGQHGLLYFVLFTFLLFVVDDTAFYWTHRAMHHPMLYKAFHRVHHESQDPTPFTTYSFHPLEAVALSVSALATMPLLVLLPWHPMAFVIFGLGNIGFNVIGHLGYEIYPRNWNRISILRWKTPAMHHYLHHQMFRGNYGLYFRWWDKICGTEIKSFEARYDALFAQRAMGTLPELKTTSAPAPQTTPTNPSNKGVTLS